MEREIFANGFETVDGCLHRHEITTEMLETVLNHERNRHLATLPLILPKQTVIYVPNIEPHIKEVKQLWS